MKPPKRCARRGDYDVKEIDSRVAVAFVLRYHYAKGCTNAPGPCFGLFDRKTWRLMGVMIFANSCSEAVRESVFGKPHKDSVTELHRLVLLDEAPHNSESMFVARALRKLKRLRNHLNAVVSFADVSKGHVGVIYQASNALFCGFTKVRTFFEDQAGRLRHPRQCGRNITVAEAIARGWRKVRSGPKCRYLFPLAWKKARKALLQRVRLTLLPYPKLPPELRGRHAPQWRQAFHDEPTRQLDLALA